MIAVPRSVISIQSPWRHTPGNISKYASRSREPSASPQNATGIEGIGSVMTSSPTSPTSGSPDGDQDSTAQPSARAWSSPSHTGFVGTPTTNAVQTSVPPEVEKSHVSGPTSSYTHRNPSGESGEPVEPTARSAERSRPLRGETEAFMHPEMKAALVPKQVTPAS